MRALGGAADRPTHQILPANFRFGELYRHEGATGQPSSTGWSRPDKTHRSFGSRLAQQLVRHVSYDTEHGFELPCKAGPLVINPVIRTLTYTHMPERMQPDHSRQVTLCLGATKDVSFRVGFAWRERRVWKTQTATLGKFVAAAEAAFFAIDPVMKDLVTILSRADRCSAELVTAGTDRHQNTGEWVLPIITDIRNKTSKVDDEEGQVAWHGWQIATITKDTSSPMRPRNEQRNNSPKECDRRHCHMSSKP